MEKEYGRKGNLNEMKVQNGYKYGRKGIRNEDKKSLPFISNHPFPLLRQ
jgi:hypothetical protein